MSEEKSEELVRRLAAIPYSGAISGRWRLAEFINEQGCAHPPQSAGLGIDFDWDFVENCTIRKL